MRLPLHADLADRLAEFQQSTYFRLADSSVAYSPYWAHHRDLIRLEIGPPDAQGLAHVGLYGDSGHYVPPGAVSPEPRGMESLELLARRTKRALRDGAHQVRRGGPAEPIHLSFAQAYDRCRPTLDRYPAQGPESIPVLPTSRDVAREFHSWSGRRAADHILTSYYLLALSCRFGCLPGQGRAALEIGAGNGNLMSLVMHYFPDKPVVIVDLPETLQLSIAYLGSLFPDRRFVLPHEATVESMQEAACVFLTPEQTPLIPNGFIDYAVNTHSFQEMTQAQIADYFRLLERVVVDGGHSLIVNRVEKAPVESEVAVQGEPVNRFADYPWPASWLDTYYLNSDFHSLVQRDDIFIRIMEAHQPP